MTSCIGNYDVINGHMLFNKWNHVLFVKWTDIHITVNRQER